MKLKLQTPLRRTLVGVAIATVLTLCFASAGNLRISDSGRVIVKSALKRHESRGLHFTLDYPETDPVARDTVLIP